MPVLKSAIDFITLGSERPVRRLVGYYLFVAIVVSALLYVFPFIDLIFTGERLEQLTGSRLLTDGLAASRFVSTTDMPPRLELLLSTTFSLLGTLVLMLPVSWVYMSVQRNRGPAQATIVQTLIILPIAVAGIILVVRNSLALAFSLAGVMAGVRFRTTLTDARDLVFVFLAIGVGFAAGVQVMTVAAVLSVLVNFVVLFNWRYGFGRNLLEPSQAVTQWVEPLQELATEKEGEKVPDRDLLMALSPKKVEAALAEGGGGGIKRWALDEVVTNQGKPSQLFYLIRLKKSAPRDEVLTAIRAKAGDKIGSADIELGAELTKLTNGKTK